MQGLTYRVSSEWEEDGSYEGGIGSYVDGYIAYTTNVYSNDYCYVTVWYSNETLGWSAEEEMESEMEVYDGSIYSFYSNPQYSLIETTTISGAECAVFEYTYLNTYSGTEEEEHDYIAFILDSKMHYSIDVSSDYDSKSLLEDILNTASIKS